MKSKIWLLLGITLITATLACARDDDQLSEVDLIKQQALQGDAGDELLYGLALIEGRYNLKADAGQGLVWIRRAAERGNAYACMVLGNAYSQGKGIEKNTLKAAQWWRRAAEKGNTESKYYLAKALLAGNGVPKDTQEAGKWLRQAAEEGNPNAQYLLGRMHHEGVIVKQDQNTALQWLRRAAANGHLEAVHLSGLIESLVKEATPLTQENYQRLHERALQNDPHAQYELALRYTNGALDVKSNPEKALFWLTRAAQNGNILAMHSTVSHRFTRMVA
ncbi:MAG: sel1 repeat family protein [gamma proteobacterium symbiont of Bathyaustriella thionipta]|nr:sel1 repeat family protein [gamma proteobacterium symbiont of Bathyaustriella thionipta]